MIGTLDEAHVHEIRQQQKEDEQSNLFDFSNDSEHTATTIAVVSKPNDTGITQVCDEFVPELGMPRRVLEDFQKLRAQLNEYNDVEEHNKAYEKCDLDRKYAEYLASSKVAQKSVSEIVRRLEEGEDITLVCFEKHPKKCHRHVLKEHIASQVEGRV